MSTLALLSTSNYLIYNIELSKLLSPAASIMIGVLCSEYQFYDMNNKLSDDGSFYCTRDKIYDKTGLTKEMQRTAEQILIKNGVISLTRKGLPAVNYYKLHADAVLAILTAKTQCQLEVGNPDNYTAGNPTTGCGETRQQAVGKPDNNTSGIPTQTINKTNNNTINKTINTKLVAKATNLRGEDLDDNIIAKRMSGNISEVKKKEKNPHLTLIRKYEATKEIEELLLKFVKHHYESFGIRVSKIRFESMLKELWDLGGSDNDKIKEIIEETINNGWRKFYLPKNKSYKQHKPTAEVKLEDLDLADEVF